MMKTLYLILIFIALGFSAGAQKYWIGGTPGNETKWNQAMNWYPYGVPDEGDLVVLPNSSTAPKTCILSHYFPVIEDEVASIAALEIHSGSILEITAPGYLKIDGSDFSFIGLTNSGILNLSGMLEITGCEGLNIDTRRGVFYNGGILKLDDLNDQKSMLGYQDKGQQGFIILAEKIR